MDSVDRVVGGWVSRGGEVAVAVGWLGVWRGVPEVPGGGGGLVARSGVGGATAALVMAYAGSGDDDLVVLELSSAPALTPRLAGAMPTGAPATLSGQKDFVRYSIKKKAVDIRPVIVSASPNSLCNFVIWTADATLAAGSC